MKSGVRPVRFASPSERGGEIARLRFGRVGVSTVGVTSL